MNRLIELIVSYYKNNNQLFGFLFCGAIYVLIFAYAYSNIADGNYKVRDDGVITMSHAKNLVDYGFIGVSPSGERLEGSSAPVQMFLYAIVYAISGIDYSLFAQIQTYIFTFLLGGIAGLFFSRLGSFRLVFVAASAYLMSLHTGFIQWHGSGMENPITHVLFLATLYSLYYQYVREKVIWILALVVFMATISRIDSVYHIAPLLVIFSVFWFYKYRNLNGLKFSFLVFILWLSFQLWRYWYYGSLLPNTASAQDISVSDRVSLFMQWDDRYIRSSMALASKIFLEHGGYLFLIFLPLLYFVKRSNGLSLLLTLCLSLLVTAYFNPFIFGQTRLDPVRSTTHFTVIGSVLVVYIMYRLSFKEGFFVLPFIFMVGLFTYKINFVENYNLCCSTSFFEKNRVEFLSVAQENEIPRPLVSNPDLGAMSWHKDFNIIDLGMLGSPIMANISHGSLLSEYYFKYAAPDLIQAHHSWICKYRKTIFEHPNFLDYYSPVQVKMGGNVSCDAPVSFGIWLRKDIAKGSVSLERQLIDRLYQDSAIDDKDVEVLMTAIEHCSAGQDCNYVARTIFRFAPELKSIGVYEDLVYRSSGRLGFYGDYLLNSYDQYMNGKQFSEIFSAKFIERNKSELINLKGLSGGYSVFMNGNKLVYINELCNVFDLDKRFYLHIIPNNIQDLAERRQVHGFDNLDFSFDTYGFSNLNYCYVEVPLPAYSIKSIRTGQFANDVRMWSLSFDN